MKFELNSALAAAAMLMASLTASGGTSQAAGVCDCCTGQVEELCRQACEATNSSGGACRPAAWFGDADAIGGGRPLNGFSFKGLDLSGATAQELEALRVWLEAQRKDTEVRARRTLRALKRGKASVDEFTASQAEREQAIINYQHGIQAYLSAYRDR